MAKKAQVSRQSPPKILAYCGSLSHVSSGEEIEVRRFIVRTDEIGFEMIMFAEDGGRWNFSDKAKLVGRNTYVADQIVGKRRLDSYESDETVRCRFEFQILKQSTQRIDVSGRWIASGESEAFDGSLKAFATPRQR